jgi:hypothetical protein
LRLSLSLEDGVARKIVIVGTVLAGRSTVTQVYRQHQEDTGGDSYCYLAAPFNTAPAHDQFLTLFVLPSGDYPIHDLRITIQELGVPKPGLHAIPETTVSLPRINQGQMIPLVARKALPVGADQYNINALFSARNGSWSEMIRLRAKDGGWTGAIRVERNDKVLVERGTDVLEKDPKRGTPIW